MYMWFVQKESPDTKSKPDTNTITDKAVVYYDALSVFKLFSWKHSIK